MFTPEQIETKLERILLQVQKPGRYVGGELNSIQKDWDSVATKVAFIFPDIYDIGVSNVGLKILYDQVNQRDDALAERAYAPWVDMEAKMREHGIPLYALESKRPLAGFDILGFTLPYETLYTNALNVLDLAQIPVKSADRDDRHLLPARLAQRTGGDAVAEAGAEGADGAHGLVVARPDGYGLHGGRADGAAQAEGGAGGAFVVVV